MTSRGSVSRKDAKKVRTAHKGRRAFLVDLRGIDARRKHLATPASRPTEREGKRIGWRESWYLRREVPQIRGVRFQPKRRQKKQPAHKARAASFGGSEGNRRSAQAPRYPRPLARRSKRTTSLDGERADFAASPPRSQVFDFNRRYAKRERTRVGVRSLLVDLRGIEPLSENRRYDFLRGQSLYWNSPLVTPGDRFYSRVAVSSMTG